MPWRNLSWNSRAICACRGLTGLAPCCTASWALSGGRGVSLSSCGTPVELESVIEEARSLREPHFAELQEQLVLLDVQRILAKYGLLGSGKPGVSVRRADHSEGVPTEAGTSFKVLRHVSLLALSTVPITERMVAVWYFASNCSNLLGDWACAVDVCESQDRACRRKEHSPSAAWKTCSSTLCTQSFPAFSSYFFISARLWGLHWRLPA